MTLSPNEHLRLTTTLQDFLEGDCSLSALEAKLQGYLIVNFDAAPRQREIYDNRLAGTIGIQVKGEHVYHMLQKYLQGNISELELSNWAAFVFASGIYLPEGETDDQRWDAGDKPLWDVLQQLMTPSLFGGLTHKIAQQYLKMIEL